MQKFIHEEKKHPTEIKPYGINFSAEIADGDSISDQDVTVLDVATGTDTTDDMLVVGSISEAANVVTCLIQAGTSGKTYYIDHWADLASGAYIMGRIVIKVSST